MSSRIIIPGEDTASLISRIREDLSQRKPRQTEVYIGQLPVCQKVAFEPATNERLTANLHEWGGSNYHISIGKVAYSLPYADWYRVFLFDRRTDVPCCRLTDGACLPFAVHDTGIIPANALVLVYYDPDVMKCGVILGSIPYIGVSGDLTFGDWISQGSNCGITREDYYWQLMTMVAKFGGVIDFSNDRPNDNLSGEWGRFSFLGGGIHVDNFMTFIRADETCGFWAFYLDRLARLAAYNYDFRSAITEKVIRNDQGEGLCFEGSTPYPWEAAGAWDSKTDPFREETDVDVQYKSPVGKYEPKHDDQQSFYRLEEYRGYLGQAYMRQLMLPPDGKKSGLNRYQDDDARIGVFREQLSLDGCWAVTSAHSIHLCKRVLIPIPKRLALPEDPKGDAATFEEEGAYKFASEYGSGENHKIANLTAPEAAELPHLLVAANMSDLHAYIFQWKGLHPFVYHKKDYSVPQESEIEPFECLSAPIEFSQLRSKTYLSRPEPKQAYVDSRYGDQDYYQTTAGVSVLPDGSVVLRDGYGSQIMMTAGQIFLSAPGDVFLLPGRDVVGYAGKDWIIRAHNSVDITAAKHDVRLKAECNMDLLAGNSGQYGRLLLENQANAIGQWCDGKTGEDIRGSGITLKARKSQIALMGADIYLRTGSPDGNIQEGDITLDASKGKRAIYTISNIFDSRVESCAQFSMPAKEPTKYVYRFAHWGCQIPAYTVIDRGLMVLKGGVICKGDYIAVQGHIITSLAARAMGYVWWLGDSEGQLRQTIEANTKTVREDVPEDNDERYAQVYTDRYWKKGQIGHATIQKKLEFSLRTESQMATGDFMLPEMHWAQLARASGMSPEGWEEPTVTHQGEELTPHPGKRAWKDADCYLQTDLALFDPQTGLDEEHGIGSAYDDPHMKDWQRKKLQGNYPVLS